MLPIVDEDPLKPSALPTVDSYEFFTAWAKKSNWKNECTVKTYVQNPSHKLPVSHHLEKNNFLS